MRNLHSISILPHLRFSQGLRNSVVLLSTLLLASLCNAATNASCEKSWKESSAAKSCSTAIVVATGDTCTITAACLNSRGIKDYVRGHFKSDSVSKVINENGSLTGGTPVSNPDPARWDDRVIQ
ncbi:hypothetical protein [Pseudomonas japonica]|uniref:Uncharacterized protein n=1 Tax=Pseudomonas japonica TaxID=256466 RepID=A0A239CR76_9PSED|nr:hypothetical protein [Pseudomonas japonica]SNS22685.1 hypothetical protein SAMN05444352_10511 [Pseudomonas japonica]